MPTMKYPAPEPRFRIYKGPGFYRDILRELLRGTWKEGDDVATLEGVGREQYGVPHCLVTAQARVAIHLAIRALVGERREIVMSPYTIFEVVNMVISAGGTPVFADLEPGTCNVSLAGIREAVSPATAAVMVTHLHGLACDIEAIRDYCAERRLPLVEDAAQALGCEVGGRPVGTFGDVGIFSFGLAKNVNGLLGGMALVRSRALYDAMRTAQEAYPVPSLVETCAKAAMGLITDLTLSPLLYKAFFFWMFRFGYFHDIDMLNRRVTVEDNPRRVDGFPAAYRRTMLPFQARLILKQLPGVDAASTLRRSNARHYHDAFANIHEIVMPPYPRDRSHVYLHFPILVPDRHALVRHLMRQNRDCAVQHLKNCADLPCFTEFRRDCPIARRTAQETVLLPTYPAYGMTEVERTARAVREFFGR